MICVVGGMDFVEGLVFVGFVLNEVVFGECFIEGMMCLNFFEGEFFGFGLCGV